MSYLDTTVDVYKAAAETPDVGLCCTTTPIWKFPGLKFDHHAGNELWLWVHRSSQRSVNNPKILYVGVGGGMELLHFIFSPGCCRNRCG